MEKYKTIKELTGALQQEKNEKKIIGFVPTMGALHNGHLSLVETCKQMCDVCVASIFVNPTQFNDSQDLKNYPRTLEQDVALLEGLKCNYLFVPEVAEVYNNQTSTPQFNFGSLEEVMEGQYRPGHFAGVAQVVTRLFDTVDPHYAFFGEKDFQQLAIINNMVAQQQRSVKIVPCSIIREEDGLAMSSRNQLLSASERKVAPQIYKTLQFIAHHCKKTPIETLKQQAIEQLESSSIMSVEYLEFADETTLKVAQTIEPKNNLRVFISVKIGNIRLIDNIALC